MRVLVTGGAGFIGSHIAEALLARGDEVTIVDNLSTGRRDNVPEGAEFVECDITAPLAARCYLEQDWDLVYHAAASYADPAAWEHDARTNVLGTIEIVRIALAARARLVYFQTSLCYGLAPYTPVTLDARLDPRGSYAISKTAAECYIRDSGVDYVSLRLANMYGPRNLSGPVPAFWKRLTAGQGVVVVDTRRDFVYVGDLVPLALAAGSHGHGPYHAASGSDTPIATLYTAVAACLGRDTAPPVLTPRGPDDAPTICLDPAATAAEYGWATSTPLRVGVAAACDWYAAHGVERTFTHLAVGGASHAR